MSKEKVIELLTRGGEDEAFRAKYNSASSKDVFIERAAADGYEFTVQELMQVINENGDTFDSYGNPPKRSIWIKD
ncbi:MAG: Nif11-like leader peptide family natural product precursor [Bacteroidales bacterium]|nr:Nif11-like leader peptide family natural product precursor [Bacteroidales bacterium]MBN2820030.1 Nif11-like leader peptide family natural product precursor [Bacteroidales bacterium]